MDYNFHSALFAAACSVLVDIKFSSHTPDAEGTENTLMLHYTDHSTVHRHKDKTGKK